MPEQTTDTAAALAAAQTQLDAAQAAHAAALKDAPPRPPEVVLHDLLGKIVARFGNHPELTALHDELGKSLPKQEPAPEEQPIPKQAA